MKIVQHFNSLYKCNEKQFKEINEKKDFFALSEGDDAKELEFNEWYDNAKKKYKYIGEVDFSFSF